MDKKCYKCDETKPLSEFNKDKHKKDGHRRDCKICHRASSRQDYDDNSTQRLEQKKQYYQGNRESVLEYKQQYYQSNKEKIMSRHRVYMRKKRRDPAFRFMRNCSLGIYKALKREGSSKNGESILQYLPYTKEELEQHLVSQFTGGMTLDNYGKWHIDHIYPQSKLPYDSMDHPNFQKCWALENLQPLWAKDNMRKSDKIL